MTVAPTVLPPEYAVYNLREIPGFPGYFVTADGGVFSAKLERRGGTPRFAWLNVQPHPRTGHLRVTLRRPDKHRQTIGIHALVAFAWLGPKPSEGMFACHKDGNPTNNHVDNLYWGTAQQNVADMYFHAKHGKGVSYAEYSRREDERLAAEDAEYEALEREAIQQEAALGAAYQPDPAYGF